MEPAALDTPGWLVSPRIALLYTVLFRFVTEQSFLGSEEHRASAEWGGCGEREVFRITRETRYTHLCKRTWFSQFVCFFLLLVCIVPGNA